MNQETYDRLLKAMDVMGLDVGEMKNTPDDIEDGLLACVADLIENRLGVTSNQAYGAAEQIFDMLLSPVFLR